MNATDPRDELFALAGIRVHAAWRDGPPLWANVRPGWQIAAAGRLWHLGSTDELRDPARLNAWRNTVANCRRRSRADPWEELPPLNRAQARQVIRLLHEVAETNAAERSHQPTVVL